MQPALNQSINQSTLTNQLTVVYAPSCRRIYKRPCHSWST